MRRGGGGGGILVLCECVKSEPSSELVYKEGNVCACARNCTHRVQVSMRKEVKRRKGSTRARGSNYVCIISVFKAQKVCVRRPCVSVHATELQSDRHKAKD